MSVRLGFLRIELLYRRRWWIILAAPPLIFAYRILAQPMPAGADPVLWFWAKPVLLGLLAFMG